MQRLRRDDGDARQSDCRFGAPRVAGSRYVNAFMKRPTKVRIVRAGGDWFERGLQLYEQRPDKDWPLTDCISFAVMKEEKLTDALTGDHHFTQAGFKALLE